MTYDEIWTTNCELRIRYTLTTNPNIDHLHLKKHMCEVCPELLLDSSEPDMSQTL